MSSHYADKSQVNKRHYNYLCVTTRDAQQNYISSFNLVRCKLICLMLYTGIATSSTQVSEDNYHEEYMAFIRFKLHL